jgi:hypothetical protein
MLKFKCVYDFQINLICMRMCAYSHSPTPWGSVFIEKSIVTQLFKKFPAFYGIQRFITVFTKAHHETLS